ncbi:MAG: hypothetical protein RLZZ413_2275, partial [Pseudomonadota bacterium]
MGVFLKPHFAVIGTTGGFGPFAIEWFDDLMLPEHHPLPVRKHSGSKREGFAALKCE